MNLPEAQYRDLGTATKADYASQEVSRLIVAVTIASARYLYSDCSITKMGSRVKGKQYLAYQNAKGKLSRALNAQLFSCNLEEVSSMCGMFERGEFERLDDTALARLLYTVGMCFPCYIDIVKTNDKKTGGTFFEFFIGHIFACRFGSNPRKQLEIPVVSNGIARYLPTDLIFDSPGRSYGLHVPVKSTTRERVIQVWAHQRILDSVYGSGRFRGILVVGSETKLDSVRKDVIEICLPEQWRIYQLHIAKLSRIYYLDPPEAYLNLNNIFPNLPVQPFWNFFREPITSF